MSQKKIEKEGNPFVDRSNSVSLITEKLSKRSVVALNGSAGSGITSLLNGLCQTKKNCIYLDLKRLSMSPESFSVEFIGSILHYFLEKGSPVQEFHSIEKLKTLRLGKKCSEIVRTVDNELQKIKPDQSLLVKSAFEFAECYCVESANNSLIIIDDFDELTKLDNFSQIQDAVSMFFDSTARNKAALFIVGSTPQRSFRSVLERRAEIVDLPYFDIKETKELFEGFAGKTDERVIAEVQNLSFGLPIIIKSIALRFSVEKVADIQKDISLVNHIFISELANKNSVAYFCCYKMFSESLNNARGDAMLRAALKVLSGSPPLRLTEVAKRIYRSSPVTKSLLERLIDVDLIKKDGNLFSFSNPVIKAWSKLMFSGIEFDHTPTMEELP